jgi:hypothetical protein
MDEPILKSGRDTLLVAVPFVMCLVGSRFRLDRMFFRSRKSSKNSYGRPPRGVTPTGEPIFTDPDGKVVEWPDRRRNAKSATSGHSVPVGQAAERP